MMDSIDRLAEELYKKARDDAEYWEGKGLEMAWESPGGREYWTALAIREEVSLLRTQRLNQEDWERQL